MLPQIPPAVCQPEKQGYNTESVGTNGTCGGGGGGGGGGGLNFDDFLPAHVQSLSRGPRSTVPVSETEAIEKISGKHFPSTVVFRLRFHLSHSVSIPILLRMRSCHGRRMVLILGKFSFSWSQRYDGRHDASPKRPPSDSCPVESEGSASRCRGRTEPERRLSARGPAQRISVTVCDVESRSLPSTPARHVRAHPEQVRAADGDGYLGHKARPQKLR